ncbi:helicase [Actinocatenispora thailandica]|uniref:Helicase n=1 Tax=Actinocatenispora thailandica TaxID=227318 RepID=A0A7R7DSJ1_9ACTN|nr:AAA family ATPase [Actinocatenispora thailandica]BCJ37060.1 helicase [Actinocatenispora thailandica]
MTGLRTESPGAAHAAAAERTWSYLTGGARTVVVDSPPGAGKSTLVRQLTARLVDTGVQVPVITQTNDQADDLAAAIAAAVAPARVGRLHAGGYVPPTADAGAAPVAYATKAAELSGCAVLVATAAKWAFVDAADQHFGLGIVDEAYQMSSAALVRVAELFDRLLLVGDPGQLSPFTVADEHVLRSYATWPLDTAAGTILRNHPDTPVVPLPVSWRLPPSAASLVSDSFYTRAFRAGTEPGQRSLRIAAPGTDAYGEVLATAADTGWGLLELPEAYLPRTDPAAVAAIATLVTRLLGTEVSTVDESGSGTLTAEQLAVGVTHRDQRAFVTAALAERGIAPGTVTVDTANRLQGRQYELVVAWHPLSGRRDASAFHLEAGRLCVLASRHRHACVVVSRAGVADQLAAYPADEPVWLGADPPQVDGWSANLTFQSHLDTVRVPLPAT